MPHLLRTNTRVNARTPLLRQRAPCVIARFITRTQSLLAANFSSSRFASLRLARSLISISLLAVLFIFFFLCDPSFDLDWSLETQKWEIHNSRGTFSQMIYLSKKLPSPHVSSLLFSVSWRHTCVFSKDNHTVPVSKLTVNKSISEKDCDLTKMARFA